MKQLFPILFCLLANCSSAADVADPSKTLPALPPPERILDCVKRVTALDTLSPIENTERVSLSEVNIPFLGPPIKDQIGIRVRFTPVNVKWLPNASGVIDHYVRHFSVYLDARANRVLAVTARLAERSPDIHEPSPEAATIQLRTNNEVYDSFPTVDPKITFMEALERLRAHGPGSPDLAQEVDGVYVMYSRMGEKPHPAWVITMRGLPPLSFPTPVMTNGGVIKEPPVWRRNYMRDVVDAITGMWLLGSNSPQPE